MTRFKKKRRKEKKKSFDQNSHPLLFTSLNPPLLPLQRENKESRSPRSGAVDLPMVTDSIRNIKSMWEKGNVFGSPGSGGNTFKVKDEVVEDVRKLMKLFVCLCIYIRQRGRERGKSPIHWHFLLGPVADDD